MQSFKFDELPSHHCALVDLGSVYNFAEPKVMEFLKGTNEQYIGMRQMIARLRDRGMPVLAIQGTIADLVKYDHSVMAALILLERMICYDHLVIDQVAFELADWQERTVGAFQPDIFRSTRVADRVYAN